MDQSIVTILPMTEDMLPRVCELHLLATAGALGARLGRRYVHAFMAWFLRTTDAIALVATNGDGDVVGYVIGAPIGYTATLNRQLAPVGLGAMLARPWLLANRQLWATLFARARYVFRPSAATDTTGLPTPAMSLVGIAVDPRAPRRGVGLALMTHFEQYARELNMASMRLSVYPSNIAARKLYERCGWRPLSNEPTATGTMYYGIVIR